MCGEELLYRVDLPRRGAVEAWHPAESPQFAFGAEGRARESSAIGHYSEQKVALCRLRRRDPPLHLVHLIEHGLRIANLPRRFGELTEAHIRQRSDQGDGNDTRSEVEADLFVQG